MKRRIAHSTLLEHKEKNHNELDISNSLSRNNYRYQKAAITFYTDFLT